jgi:catechol 2,3-dioxygenase-like lactoylglutathione lyase family enzyme
MPVGDPMSDDSLYIMRGNVTRVWLASIPVSDLKEAVAFYTQALGLKLQLESLENNWAEVGPDEPSSKIALYVPNAGDPHQPGGPSGVVLETDSIFELHRKLVDEEVVFKMKPERRPWGGLLAVFLDQDGNEIEVVEDPEHYTRSPKPKETPKRAACETDRGCNLIKDSGSG